MLMIPKSLDFFLDLLKRIKAQKNVIVDCVVAAADHGVAKESISLYSYGDTYKIFKMVASSHSPISKLSKSLGIKPYFINVGCLNKEEHPRICSKYWVAQGTKNIAIEDAISENELLKIWDHAETFVSSLESDHLCMGEIGVGNTITSTLIAAILSNQDPVHLVGTGSGIDDEKVKRKKELIAVCHNRFYKIGNTSLKDPKRILMSLGGLELAWNVGLILSASKLGKQIFLDGLNTTASACLAYLIEPAVRENLIATHLSREKSHQYLLDYLKLTPFLKLDLALGQGFGALLGFSFLYQQHKIFIESDN